MFEQKLQDIWTLDIQGFAFGTSESRIQHKPSMWHSILPKAKKGRLELKKEIRNDQLKFEWPTYCFDRY